MNKKKEILKKALNLERGIQSNIEVLRLFPHLHRILMSKENELRKRILNAGIVLKRFINTQLRKNPQSS